MIKLYQTPSPIFFDPKGYRWKVFLTILLISSIFFGFIFFYIYKTKTSISNIESDFKSLNYESYLYERNLPKKGLITFLDNEYSSYYSLKENITRVAAVVVPWVNFDTDGKLRLDSSDLKDLESDFVNKFKPGVNLFLQISDYNYAVQGTGKDSFTKFLDNYNDDDIKRISDYISNNNFKGIVYSFESEKWDTTTIDKFLKFRSQLDPVIKEQKLVVADTLNLNVGDEVIQKLQGKQNIFILNYWNNSFNDNSAIYDFRKQPEQLKNLIQKIPNSKYYINFPTYNKDIVFGSEGEVSYVQKKSFGDTVELVKKQGLVINNDFNNSYIDYIDDEKKSHRIWLGDAALLFNQLFDLSKLLKEDSYEGYAFSNSGFEDNSIWDMLKADSFNGKLEILEKNFKVDTLVENKGQGVLAKVLSDFEFGIRRFKFSEGYISSQIWEKYPVRSIVQRVGYKPKTLSLTFDDGPDPIYTPQILDILKKYNIKATFFVIGKNIKEYPEIAKRIVSEGHIIANHSYSHPRLNNLSTVTVDTEISGTDEILRQLVNVKTDFFRTPYNDIYGFNTENDLVILRELRKYDKFAVEDDVDTKDWLIKDPNAINNKTFDILDKQSGSVLLLHDGGGDRTSTVKSLPSMIEGIQKRGYAIENLNTLTSDDLAKLSNESAQYKQFQEQEFSLFASKLFFNIFVTTVIFSIIIGVIKYILMFALYLYSVFKNKKQNTPYLTPKVSIIVPCYNEQKVICNTINSLLLSDYPNFEIVMVDDGSKDNSYKVVKKAFKKEKRVSAYTKENGGKSSALNFGISVAKSEFVICVDADTVFAQDSVRKLMRHFRDENIGGVAGNVQIGNATNNLTKAQQLEYALSQNFEKQAFSSVNSVVVVPGPIGAWRKPVILGAGGYHKDNLAEDTDLTLRVLQQGWEIHYEQDAICITESPEDYKSFIKQRNRWQFGMLQVLFKNFEILFNPNYGFIGLFTLPIILFQYLLMSLYPIMMVSIGGYLLGFLLDSYNGGIALGFSFLWQNKLFLYFSAIYILLDAFKIILAISKERHIQNKYKMLLIIPYYLFIFQNLMSAITFWTLVRAIRGKIATWGHLTRTGSVSLNQVQKQNN
ncbi:MAG: glycosyltransferase [candidate division SR1 bacterium]|nr:glycosyltransferase [candidate division SR1 bacterium]